MSERTPETCSHPLSRIVWRGGEDVWCWVCRTTEDAPRLLSQPEAWMVIQRWREMEERMQEALSS